MRRKKCITSHRKKVYNNRQPQDAEKDPAARRNRDSVLYSENAKGACDMNILMLTGSPRKTGNSAAMAKAFQTGAERAGHKVTVCPVGTMNIHGCLACEYCHTKGEGTCIQKDDMQEIYPLLETADLIVFVSAVHYFGFTGQLQSAISRFYAPHKPAAKKYAMLLSSGSPDVYGGLEQQYHNMLAFFGAEDLGIRELHGEENKTEAALAEIEAFGASVK